MRKLLFPTVLLLFVSTVSQAQITSIIDGAWSDTLTWNAGRVPISSDAVTIATTVTVDSDLVFQALTVLQGGTLEGVAGENKVLRIGGNLLNQGSITQSGTGNDFRLFVAGDIVNEGTLNVRKLWFTGMTDQNLSQTAGAQWLSTVYNNRKGGRLVATTDLDFAGDFALNAGSFRTLVMNGHDLIVSGTGTISYVTVVSPGRLVGRTDSTAFARNTTFTGPVTVVETVRLSSDVVFDSLVTVTGTLTREVSSNNTSTVTFNQDLVNQGTIEDEHPDRGKLRLRVYGNIRNEGIWAASKTEFRGESDQTLYLTSGKIWAGGFDWEKDSGAVIALTNQVFGGLTQIDSLIMGELDLAVSGEGTFTSSFIYDPGTIRSIDGNEEFATGTHIVGDTVIEEWLSPGYQMTIDGDLSVVGTLESARGGSSGATTALTVEGTLTNQGTIKNGENGAFLSLRVGSDVLNSGSWTSEALELINAGSRTVWVPGIDSDVYCGQRFSFGKEGSLLLDGDNAMPDLSVTGERVCAVLFGATLALSDPPSSSIENFGSITVTRSAADGLPDREFYKGRVRIESGIATSVSVTHVGNQVPSSFGNALPGWWRVNAPGAGSSDRLTTLRLNYNPDDLQDADQSDITPFYSSDGGSTWSPVGTGVSVTRGYGNVVLGNALSAGDYALTTDEYPVAGIGGVLVSIIGRNQVRVGRAPNRFTIQYSNASLVPTSDLVIAITVPPDMHIQRIEDTGTGANVMTADNFSGFSPEDGAVPDSTALLALDALGPLESRTFDVIVTADPDAPGKISGPRDAQILPVIAVAVVWTVKITAVALASSYVSSVVEEYARQASGTGGVNLKNVIINASTNTWADWTGSARKPIWEMMKAGVVLYLFPTALGLAMVETTLFGIETLFSGLKGVHAANSDAIFIFKRTKKKVRKVQSLDPNEKVGPSGFEGEGFISSAGRVTYQILFENKAEATAAAYEVAIDDTLGAVFDPSSVIFEVSSHTGWEFSVDGNKLRWYIEGIELAPNVNPPEGEGFVQFSVLTIPGLPTGTVLENRASIVFDVNPPILTNTFVNTLDFGAPVTTMTPLLPSLPADSIVVKWTAVDGDGESGVQSTIVYASMDSGPFEPIGVSSSDSLVVRVDHGHEYSFYALSSDYVGNVEQQRPALVTTQVVSGVATEDEALPFVFSLDPNYPNPFNPVTTISFSLPVPGQARINVYDVTGRLVAKLVDGMLPAGPQYVAWDARNMASGVYFYRLIQGNQIQTRPMVLLR